MLKIDTRARRDLNPGPSAPKADALSKLGHGPGSLLSYSYPNFKDFKVETMLLRKGVGLADELS
jgi:hypothetical protein